MWEYLMQPVEWLNLDNNEHSVFTPDLFPHVKLTPCSVVSIDFKLKKGIPSIIILIALLILYFSFDYEVGRFLSYNIDFISPKAIPIIICALITINMLFILRRVIKMLKYKCNADYIEATPIAKEMHRIAKKQKLGLFDKKRNTIILRAKYDNITLFDADHFLIERKGKQGLYSIRKNRFIVPVRYDKIDPFVNSITKCSKEEQLYYYDINGHRMK